MKKDLEEAKELKKEQLMIVKLVEAKELMIQQIMIVILQQIKKKKER